MECGNTSLEMLRLRMEDDLLGSKDYRSRTKRHCSEGRDVDLEPIVTRLEGRILNLEESTW